MYERRRVGFTIIEMLVVVGIIAVLVGILLPALSGAQKNSRKKTELNFLRQVGFAWSMYANSYDDSALPGYIEPEVQQLWKVEWESINHDTIAPKAAAPYTWRLMPYLDFNPEVLAFYDDEWERDFSVPEHVLHFAEHPAFGYNAVYVGGWWQQVHVSGNTVAKPSFFDAEVAGSSGKPATVVATRVTQIRKPSEITTFCSATLPRQLGVHKSRDIMEGWHSVFAPATGSRERWKNFGGVSDPNMGVSSAAGSVYEIDVSYLRGGVPLGRYTQLVAVLYADGHTDTQTAGAMADMRKWTSAAEERGFRHTDGSLPPPNN